MTTSGRTEPTMAVTAESKETDTENEKDTSPVHARPVESNGSIKLRIWRGDASGGDLVAYDVPVQEGMVVLDAVLWVQQHQDGDLGVRWNCKAAKCGSCSAEIDGF